MTPKDGKAYFTGFTKDISMAESAGQELLLKKADGKLGKFYNIKYSERRILHTQSSVRIKITLNIGRGEPSNLKNRAIFSNVIGTIFANFQQSPIKWRFGRNSNKKCKCKTGEIIYWAK